MSKNPKFTVGFSVSLAQRLIVGKFFYRAYDKFTLQYLADKYDVDGNLIEIELGEFWTLFKGFFLDPRLIGAWEVLKSAEDVAVKGLRTNISTLTRLSDDFAEYSLLRQYLLDHPGKVDEWSLLESTFRSLGDPVKDILGPGAISHADEWNQIIDAVESAGGKVEFTTNPNKIAYEPALSSGRPGRIFIQEDASITALRHEYQHFLDDQAEGYIGFQGLIDPDFRVTSEYNAYRVEIDAMLEMGENGVAQTLKDNFLNEVTDIMSKFGTPKQSTVDLIDELLNL